jgi:hypothetical protein
MSSEVVVVERNSSAKNRLTTIAFVVIAIFALFTTSLNWWRQVTGDVFDPNQSGDWLLNYSGGFVRRGLFGEIIDTLVPKSVNMIVVTGAIQILLLVALFALVGALYLRSDRSPAWLMLCLSPAVLLFPAVNPEGAFRKELLALIVLGVLALGARNGITTSGLVIALSIYFLAVFSHEASIVALPGILFLVYFFSATKREALTKAWLALFIGISVIGFLTSILVPSNQSRLQAICDSWIERGISECNSGALSSLTMSTQESISFLHSNYFPSYFAYLLIIALTLIPLFAVRFLPAEWRFSLVVLLFVLPLFLVAWDYGRWIYLAVSQLTLVALALASRGKLKTPVRVPLVAALVYVLAWGFAWYETPWREGFAIQVLQALAIIPQ